MPPKQPRRLQDHGLLVILYVIALHRRPEQQEANTLSLDGFTMGAHGYNVARSQGIKELEMADWTAGNPYLGTNNPYLQGVIDSSLGDMVRNYNTAVKPNTESAMVNSGSFGNSGLQQMQQNQQYDLQKSLGTQANNLRAADYNNQQQMYQWDQNFNRGLWNDQFNQNQQNLQNAMGLLSTGNQFNQQDLTNANNIQNTPLSYMNQFGNLANSFAGQGGISNQTQTAQGSPLMGALGGWKLGNAYAKSNSGSGSGSLSDAYAQVGNQIGIPGWNG
jgi:hypothetical protein